MKLTLTFDNGPDPDVTPLILDLLLARGVRAHFYVLGKHVATPAGRALVARMVAEGHLVGNHSYTHVTPLGDDLRPDAVATEIIATEALLAPLLPAGTRRFRPFGGGGVIAPHLLSPAAAAHLVAEQYTCVLWNAVPRDWIDATTWPASAVASLAAQDHTVLVLHDVADACLDQLATFLDLAATLGVELTLDLPASCTPILGGRITSDLAPFVRGGAP